jgi:hypothetical protein
MRRLGHPASIPRARKSEADGVSMKGEHDSGNVSPMLDAFCARFSGKDGNVVGKNPAPTAVVGIPEDLQRLIEFVPDAAGQLIASEHAGGQDGSGPVGCP